MKKLVKRFIWVGLGIAIVFFIFKMVESFRDVNEGFAEWLPSTFSLNANDSSLFKKEFISDIQVFEVLHNKVRNPISLVSYKGYNIIFYKIDFHKSGLLKSFLCVDNHKSSRSNSYSYQFFEQHDFLKFQVKARHIPPINKVYFSYSGELFNIEMENDSIGSYTFFCEDFSIKHEEDGPVDFIAEKKGSGKVPTNILFWKGAKAINIFIMTPGNDELIMKSNLLLEILNIRQK